MAALLWLCGCPPKSALQPAWNSSRLDFGQGQLVVDLRVRWVAVGDAHGALIKTPEGAEAYLRVFNCSHGSKHIRDELRSALRSNSSRTAASAANIIGAWVGAAGPGLTTGCSPVDATAAGVAPPSRRAS